MICIENEQLTLFLNNLFPSVVNFLQQGSRPRDFIRICINFLKDNNFAGDPKFGCKLAEPAGHKMEKCLKTLITESFCYERGETPLFVTFFDKKKPPLSSRLKQGFLHIFCKKCSVSVFPIQPPLKTYLHQKLHLMVVVLVCFDGTLFVPQNALALVAYFSLKRTIGSKTHSGSLPWFWFGFAIVFCYCFVFCHHIAMCLVLVSSSCTMMMTMMKTLPCGGATCRPLAEKMKFVQSCIEETL